MIFDGKLRNLCSQQRARNATDEPHSLVVRRNARDYAASSLLVSNQLSFGANWLKVKNQQKLRRNKAFLRLALATLRERGENLREKEHEKPRILEKYKDGFVQTSVSKNLP